MYVALLRGINVGGKNTVAMADLKAVFEELGCQEVKTYINSGNVLFNDKRTLPSLQTMIATALEDRFGFAMSLQLRDRQAIKKLCAKIPLSWTNDQEQKTDVMFLDSEIDNPGILNQITINPKLENVRYTPGALVWNIARKNATKGNGIKLVKSNLYPHMTIRNVNTVRKLNSLMSV